MKETTAWVLIFMMMSGCIMYNNNLESQVKIAKSEEKKECK